MDGRRVIGEILKVQNFSLEDFNSELSTVETNHVIGSRVEFENADVRIWSIEMDPGDRFPFHCHSITYFWLCIEPGTMLVYRDDGTVEEYAFKMWETRFSYLGNGAVNIHSLENICESRLRFIAVELLSL